MIFLDLSSCVKWFLGSAFIAVALRLATGSPYIIDRSNSIKLALMYRAY